MMKFLILLALPTLVAAVSYEIPLTKIESSMVKMMKDGTWEDHLMKMNALRPTGHKKPYHQKVLDYIDYEYTANITIGTPGQFFTVVLDTASSYFWIPDVTCGSEIVSPNCNQCNDQQHEPACQFVCEGLRRNSTNGTNAEALSPVDTTSAQHPCFKKHKFNQTESTTYVVNGTKFTQKYQYGGITITGFLGVDIVRFGTHEKALAVPNVTFGQATTVTYFPKHKIDGILGLGFPSLNADGVLPPLFVAIDQTLIRPIFTIFLRHHKFGHKWDGGQFTYGGRDSKHCGRVIAYQYLLRQSQNQNAKYFKFQFKSIGIGQTKFPKPYSAISDSGIGVILGPRTEVMQMAEAAGAKYERGDGFVVSCTAKPADLELVIGQHTYKVEAENYIIHLNQEECILAFGFYNSAGFLDADWLLGAPLMRSYCHIYDYLNERIGFAPPKTSQRE